jgi:hypothetical protein
VAWLGEVSRFTKFDRNFCENSDWKNVWAKVGLYHCARTGNKAKAQYKGNLELASFFVYFVVSIITQRGFYLSGVKIQHAKYLNSYVLGCYYTYNLLRFVIYPNFYLFMLSEPTT